MRKSLAIVIFFATLALCVAGFYCGRNIPFASQWPLYEALRNTAAIIFAVVGAWLAIIYPDRLKLSFGQTSDKVKNGNMALLLTPAIHSTVILVTLLLIGILVPMLKQVPALLEHLALCRGISFAVLTLLTVWQALIVVMAIFPADIVKSAADKETAEQEVINDRDKLVRKK